MQFWQEVPGPLRAGRGKEEPLHVMRFCVSLGTASSFISANKPVFWGREEVLPSTPGLWDLGVKKDLHIQTRGRGRTAGPVLAVAWQSLCHRQEMGSGGAIS